MVFSSITFLYYFLPILLLIYFIVPFKFKNLVLFIFSLLFYFYGEPAYIWILLLSIFINYLGGLVIGKSDNKKIKKIFLIITILVDVGLLFYFIFNLHLILIICIMNEVIVILQCLSKT